MKIWNFGLLTCLKKLYHLLVGWIGNQDSDFPKTFHSLSLSEKESAVSESARSMYLLDKNQPRKYEILAVKFLGVGEKIEISICIGWFCLKEKLHEQKLTQQFLLLTVNGCGKFHQNLNHGFQFSLLQNAQVSLSRQEGRNFKFHRFVLSKKKQFWGGTEFETKSQFSPKLSMALHCQSRRLLCQFFAQETYFLAKTNLWNLKFWPFLPGWIKLAQFFLGWIGNQELIFPQTFHGTSVSEQETAISIYWSSNLCFSQNQPRKFEILTLLAWFNQIGTAFPGLNCKPGVSFPQNFPWHFSVRTGDCYVNFLLKKLIF